MAARFTRFLAITLLPTCLFLAGCASRQSLGPIPSRGAAYESPQTAVAALVEGLRSRNRDQLLVVLGPGSEDLIDTGDEVADRSATQDFIEQYDRKHEMVTNADGSMTLQIGEENWPVPIPLVKVPDDTAWYFDTQAGYDEIINRRIGRNELSTIQTCLAIVDAQREYALEDADGNGIRDYAMKATSDPGKKNGLYWVTAEGEKPSPLGLLAAQAMSEGYAVGSAKSKSAPAFHGYRYRLLTAQGPEAPGGAMDYVIQGKLLGGFAVVAYPADYGNSGVMTFIVSHHGQVFQADLGPKTPNLAAKITTFNPGTSWQAVDASSH